MVLSSCKVFLGNNELFLDDLMVIVDVCAKLFSLAVGHCG